MGPGGGLAVAGVAGEAAVQDADEAVAEGCAHPAHRGRVPAFARHRRDGRVASACGLVVGVFAVPGLLPEYRPASGRNSCDADSGVGAAAGHGPDRGLAANGMGPGAPGPGGRPCRGGWGGDRPPVGSPGFPGAFHRRAHAPAAGPAHEGAWRVGCVARAVVVVLVGVFVVKAAVLSSAKQAKGLDAIFRSVAGWPAAPGSWACSPPGCCATAFTA